MKKVLDKIINFFFRTKRGTIISVFILTMIVTSIIYCVNNYCYYNSIATITDTTNEHYKKTIKLFLRLSPDNDINTSLKRTLQRYIDSATGNIKIKYIKNKEPIWEITNNHSIDYRRTMFRDNAIIPDNTYLNSYIEYNYQRSIRPPFSDDLMRAWTWSIPDWISKGKDNYLKSRLYQRSLPLWTYFFILVIFISMVALVIRSFYKRNKWLNELNKEKEKTGDLQKPLF